MILNVLWILIYFSFPSIAIGQGVPSTSSIRSGLLSKISNLTIYKCSCGINQALRDGECVPATNIIPLWHPPDATDLYIDISNFKEVVLKELNCPEGFSKVRLGEDFLIYSNGLFDNLLVEGEPPQKEYCIEYLYEEDHLQIDGRVCVQNPAISSCCQAGQLSASNGNCYSKNFHFQPPLFGSILWDDYTLNHNVLKCDEGTIMKKVPLSLPYQGGASLLGYPLGTTLLWFSEFSFNEFYFKPEEYCVSTHENSLGNYSYEAHFCIPDPYIEHQKLCGNTSCIRKCCSNGYSYYAEQRSCVPTNAQLSYTLYDLKTVRKMNIIIGFPICDDFYFVELNDENRTMISNNGSLTTADGLLMNPTQYCLEEVIEGNNTEERSSKGLVCFLGATEKCRWRWVAGSLLLGFSCLFYLATLIVYISVSDLNSKMVGKCLISEVSSLLIAYLTLIFLQNFKSHRGVYCNFPGTVEHVAILASFFWLNVMCYDMWRTFRSVRPADDTRNTKKSFLRYSIYAWGCPIVIGAIRLTIDHIPFTEEEYPWLIKSYIGITHCFFSSNYSGAKWAYLYGPILFLLLMNLGFFVHVAIILYQAHKQRANLISRDSSTTGKNFNDLKDRVRLYLKLFIIMGLSWLLEIIMWVTVPESDCYFWGLDIVNMFQGVFIFIIFVCKKSTLKKIKSAFVSESTNQSDELTQLR